MLAFFNSPQIAEFLPIALIFLAVIVAILIIWIVTLERKLGRLFGNDKSGKNSAKTLEDNLTRSNVRLSSLEKFQSDTLGYLRTIESRVRRSFQASETVRFNPFKGSGDGGHQSFATSLLSENGDGVVISSLYSRDRVSVFAKPIKNFKPLYELSDEETEALNKAGAELKKRDLQK